MVHELTEERIAEWLAALSKKLEEQDKTGHHDIVIDYRSVSCSFPIGSHPDYFFVPQINWEKLQAWANSIGWDIQTAPECTHPDQQSTPRVRFTKRA
jgi:hypothetical protein